MLCCSFLFEGDPVATAPGSDTASRTGSYVLCKALETFLPEANYNASRFTGDNHDYRN
jgi:hypothetical protein